MVATATMVHVRVDEKIKTQVAETRKSQQQINGQTLPRASDYTREFQKDWQRLTHSGRYDMNQLKEAQRDSLRAFLVTA